MAEAKDVPGKSQLFAHQLGNRACSGMPIFSSYVIDKQIFRAILAEGRAVAPLTCYKRGPILRLLLHDVFSTR
jgi:hypothetical protein